MSDTEEFPLKPDIPSPGTRVWVNWLGIVWYPAKVITVNTLPGELQLELRREYERDSPRKFFHVVLLFEAENEVHLVHYPEDIKDYNCPEKQTLIENGYVVAFVDYKLDNDRSGIGIIQLLNKLGAQVEKTFNHKVTHAVFRDGYQKIYDKAIKRKIPLKAVNSKLAKNMLDPVDYPPVGIKKYTKPRETNKDHPKSLKKYDNNS